MSTKDDIEKQSVKVRAAYDYMKAREGTWVRTLDIAAAIHSLAVSTKLSQVRELPEMDGYELVWNQDRMESCYMLRAKRLARDASTYVERTLF